MILPKAFAVLALLTADPAPPVPAEAASPPTEVAKQTDRNCTDDRGVDRCSAAQHRKVLDLFGMQPIETHLAAGEQVRRAFYVDGYGRDVIAIAFVRAPERSPMLFVHFPSFEGKRHPTEQAVVPAETWRQVLARSQHFDREMTDEPQPPEEGVMLLCLHSWVYTMEATEPEAGGADRLRREVEDACEDGLGEPYATALVELAVPLLPHCAALDPEHHRNSASLLRACGILRGDRLSAAAIYDEAVDLDHATSNRDKSRLSSLFDYRASLTWDGEAIDPALDGWMDQVGGEGRAELFFDLVIGEGPGRGRLEGGLFRWTSMPDQPRKAQQAPVTLHFVSAGDGFRIERAVVGAFQPVEVP